MTELKEQGEKDLEKIQMMRKMEIDQEILQMKIQPDLMKIHPLEINPKALQIQKIF